MPRLRPVTEKAPVSRIPDRTETVPRQPHPAAFKKGHQKLGGRQPGVANILPRSTRESILQGLEIAGNTMGDAGVVSYVTQAALADFKHGIALLGMITPRSADLTIRNAPPPVTLEQLDAQLASMNLPRMRDLFEVDFRGDPVIEADEAELVAPEPPVSK